VSAHDVYAVKLPWIYAALPLAPGLLAVLCVALASTISRAPSWLWWVAAAAVVIGMALSVRSYTALKHSRAAFEAATTAK